jgi:hypothetical protein
VFYENKDTKMTMTIMMAKAMKGKVSTEKSWRLGAWRVEAGRATEEQPQSHLFTLW